MIDLEIWFSLDKICASNRGYTNYANKILLVNVKNF